MLTSRGSWVALRNSKVKEMNVMKLKITKYWRLKMQFRVAVKNLK